MRERKEREIERREGKKRVKEKREREREARQRERDKERKATERERVCLLIKFHYIFNILEKLKLRFHRDVQIKIPEFVSVINEQTLFIPYLKTSKVRIHPQKKKWERKKTLSASCRIQ